MVLGEGKPQVDRPRDIHTARRLFLVTVLLVGLPEVSRARPAEAPVSIVRRPQVEARLPVRTEIETRAETRARLVIRMRAFACKTDIAIQGNCQLTVGELRIIESGPCILALQVS